MTEQRNQLRDLGSEQVESEISQPVFKARPFVKKIFEKREDLPIKEKRE